MLKTVNSSKTALSITTVAGMMVGVMIGATLIYGGPAPPPQPRRRAMRVAHTIIAIPGAVIRFGQRVADLPRWSTAYSPRMRAWARDHQPGRPRSW